MRRTTTKKGARVRRKLADREIQKKGACLSCSKDLAAVKVRAFFVEEEIGRVFCSQACIVDYFAPDIKRLEKEYFQQLSSDDLSAKDRKKLSDLRWKTLKKPDEVWREKTLAGDYRFTLITEFNYEQKSVWCICICLFLRGEPSFLYLAFPTRIQGMVAHYRKGERVKIQFVEEASTNPKARSESQSENQPKNQPKDQNEDNEMSQEVGSVLAPTDGLATDWTDEELMRAQLAGTRQKDDIPTSDFLLYNYCVSETIEGPDEVWSIEFQNSSKLLHFMRSYPEQDPRLWYIVVARETEDEEGIEILDAFPTRDSNLVDQFRKGEQQVGTSSHQLVTRTVH